MVIKLEGPSTVFLPFNQGGEWAAGNPVNPAGGHRMAYLWEQVWQREGWLEIPGRYLIARKDAKKQISSLIFPRFHQLHPEAVGGGVAVRAGWKISGAALCGIGEDKLHRMDGAFFGGTA